MTTYKLIKRFTGMSMVSGEISIVGVNRTDKSGVVWFIPICNDNTDYQAYLKWLEEGNQPISADEPING